MILRSSKYKIGKASLPSWSGERLEAAAACALRIVLLCLLAIASLFPDDANAQATADWTGLGLNNFQAVPNGGTLTVGPRTITINQTSTISGGTFTPHYSSGFLSYYNGNISSQAGPLLYSFDNSNFDADDKITTTYTFDAAVTGLAFRLLDVDRNIGAAQDAVEIWYDNGSGSWQNAANTPAFYTVGTTNSRVANGYMTGFLGNSASGLTSTAGDVSIDFGATTIKRVRIIYFSGESETGDPSGPNQYIGLSDMEFDLPAADLSLTKTFGGLTSNTGRYTLSVTNAPESQLTATGVTVSDTLPAGVTLLSTSGTGTYSGGIWTLGTPVAPGETVTIELDVIVTATSGTITNTAQIRTSSVYDYDSTPGNGVTSEDDYAEVSFVSNIRLPGYVPPLTKICSIGNQLGFSWAAPTTWLPAGSLMHEYNVTGLGNIKITVAPTPTGFINNAPEITTGNTGGGAAGTLALYLIMNNNSNTETSTTTITLPAAVPGLQFKIFDVDYSPNAFTDKVTITGTHNGNTVLPILSNGTANYIDGNSAIGDGQSGATDAFGNVVVSFASPVSEIKISHGNHIPTTPNNSGTQAISIHDFTFCRPSTTLSVTKISSIISDPINGTTTPKRIPGAIVQYCILISNSGGTNADMVVTTDTLAGPFTYNPGTMRTGVNCGSATELEDDNNIGADESPIGASISGSTITATATTLNAGSTMALTFRVTID
ncbi:DUF11 domain-containing protein [Parasphingorhabdus sp.]|uniref:DUF11 domain-containing protein n=1 Tax=Parasphingorhabdus sp. TaxID=2709688 RepID=UPI003A8E173D